MPAFVLIIMFGTFPDGKLTLMPFADRTGCDKAANAIISTFSGVSYASCYDTHLGIANRIERR